MVKARDSATARDSVRDSAMVTARDSAMATVRAKG
jgi:hypothetical protein